MPNVRVLRQAAYFAGSVFITVELADFPMPIFANWKANAVAISLVNLTPILAGLLSGIEIIQFAPFSFPLAFPWYIVVGGVLSSIAPMILTLLILGYVFSKRKDPLSLSEVK